MLLPKTHPSSDRSNCPVAAPMRPEALTTRQRRTSLLGTTRQEGFASLPPSAKKDCAPEHEDCALHQTHALPPARRGVPAEAVRLVVAAAAVGAAAETVAGGAPAADAAVGADGVAAARTHFVAGVVDVAAILPAVAAAAAR